MFKSKLVDLLRTFSQDDWKGFDAYLRSPLFNKRESSLVLLNALAAVGPVFEERSCERYSLWERAFPKSYPTDQDIAAEMNALTRHAEAFLGLTHYLQNDRLRELDVLRELESRRLSKNYRLQLKRLSRLMDSEEVKDSIHYLLHYQLAGVELRESLQSKVRTYDANLQQTVESLDDFYLITRLRMTCELLNRQSILSGAFDAESAIELMTYLRTYDQSRVPTLSAYYLVLSLLTGEGEMAEFHELAGILSRESKAFNIGEWQDLFSYAQNYCIRKVRAGESEFLKELFALYKLGLTTGNMFESNILSPWKYKNIASVGLRLEEFEWVREFIETYKTRLPIEFQENAYAYNLADLHYRTGAYDKALRGLLRVEFSDVFYSLDTRKMMLMIYFEQGEEEPMRSLIASFRLFLKRNTLISENNRKAYSNFVNLVQAIHKQATTQSAVGLILEKIDQTRPLIEEGWLMEMAKKGFQEI